MEIVSVESDALDEDACDVIMNALNEDRSVEDMIFLEARGRFATISDLESAYNEARHI